MKKWLPALLAVFLLAGGCGPSRDSGNSGNSGNSGTETPAAGNTAGPAERTQLRPPRPQPATRPAEAPSGNLPDGPSAVSSPAGLETLAYRTAVPPRLPEDMRIGPLGDTLAGDPLLTAAESFLRGLEEGKILRDLAAGSSRDYLEKVFQPILEEGPLPVRYRLGIPRIYEPGKARINIRLYGTRGRTGGELLLEEEGAVWRIGDLQIDWNGLSEEYKKDFDLYEPQTYRWLELY